MRRFRLLAASGLVCTACTLTGLGDYEVTTCPSPTGATTHVATVALPVADSDLTFTSASGVSPIGAFLVPGPSGNCVEGVGTGNYIGTGCSFFSGMGSTASGAIVPRQPWAVPMGGGGDAVVAIAITAPCTQGQLYFQYEGQQGIVEGKQAACDPASPGAALPSFAPSGSTTGVVAWYETSFATRADPVQSCAGAMAAPLVAAAVNVSTSSATFGAPMTLTSQSISIRPPATLKDGSQVILAAPNGNDVGIWTLDGTSMPASPISIPGLVGARAVSIATDGAGNFAVVAEIGCVPQSIVLAIGTLAGGFSKTTTIVAGGGSGAAVQPTLAWNPTEKNWIVSWIATPGRALAMRVDASGNLKGRVIDPGLVADGASATVDGNLLAYVRASQSFVKASLGCGP